MRVAAAIDGAGVLVVAIMTGCGLAQVTPSPPSSPSPRDQTAVPHFVEEAVGAGISHSYDGGFEYYVGGGVALFDCDGNGLSDLYLAGGASRAALFRNASQAGGALRFEGIASIETDLDAVTGAYPLDIDSDGITDLAILRYGENVLLRGRGDCTFERANEAWSFDGGAAWTTAFSARWDAGRAWPTLAVGNYLGSTDPNDYSCTDNDLFRPTALDDGFAAPQTLSPGWCPLSMLFSDWGRSGERDLRVSNDRHYYTDSSAGQEQLWRIPIDGEPALYTEADGWRPVRIWGMGIASYDVTGDGYPDYYLTSQADNKLQSLADGADRPAYDDVALRRGVTAHRPYEGDTTLPSTGWHDEFQDVNSDGLIDLFIAKGNVELMLDFAARDPSNLLLGRPDGTFVEAASAAGILDFARARGAGIIDLNADGLLDIVEVVRSDNVRVWRNIGSGSANQPAPMGNWLELKVREDGPNPDAVGAWVEVRIGDRVQTREVTVGGGHVSGQLGPLHFGLGPAQDAEVRVTWPSMEVGPWQHVAANALYELVRGQPGALKLR